MIHRHRYTMSLKSPRRRQCGLSPARAAGSRISCGRSPGRAVCPGNPGGRSPGSAVRSGNPGGRSPGSAVRPGNPGGRCPDSAVRSRSPGGRSLKRATRSHSPRWRIVVLDWSAKGIHGARWRLDRILSHHRQGQQGHRKREEDPCCSHSCSPPCSFMLAFWPHPVRKTSRTRASALITLRSIRSRGHRSKYCCSSIESRVRVIASMSRIRAF